MRAAAPVQVSLRHFGVWRTAVCGLALAGLLAVGLWLIQTVPTPPASVIAAAVGAAVVVLCLAWQSLRIVPSSLRWDGLIWHLGSLDTAGDEPTSGEIEVAIDLGAWLLLRFRPEAPFGRGPSTAWLPVQRQGLEQQWHALRCAVYSPRPPPAVAPKADL